MREMTRLARGSVEAGTVKTYLPGLHKFTAFVNSTCASLGRPPWPHATTSELRDLVNARGVVEAFIVYAHMEGLQADSIKVYISALKYYGTDGYGRPSLPDALGVTRLLKGCVKAQGPPSDGKLGIGIVRLRSLLAYLDRHPRWSKYDVIMWKAMVCCAFFAASRVSEYLETHDEVKLLTLGNVSRLSSGGIRFMLYKTKNNSVGRPQEVDFPNLEAEYACPVRAIESFLKVRVKSPDDFPLFIDETRRTMCPERFNTKLKQLMAVIEPDLKDRFTSKSFRIGMTSDAFALGVDEVDMGNLGRWAFGSKAYMSYVVSLARAKRAAGVQSRVSHESARLE